jgi:hypothetical protein
MGKTSNVRHQTPEIPSLVPGKKNDADERVIESKGVSYTAQDCIDVIRNLAESFPNTNITRDFFRKNSELPESVYTGFFGTFPEFLRSAELQHSRAANKVRNQVARHAAVDHIRKISDQRLSMDELYVRKDKKRFQTMVACSDLHDQECDPFYLRVLTDTIKNVNPDVICLDGDIFDVPEFGRYNVDPREWDVVGRVQSGLKIIADIREAAGDKTQIDFIEGNHEARVIRHLLESDPGLRALLSGLHDFDLRKLFGLDRYEVNYIANCDLFTFTDAQQRKEVSKNFKLYWGCVLAHHYPHGRDYGTPGFNGHHHKHQSYSEHNVNYGSYEWHQMGGGHKREASYCDGSKWNNGFLVVMADTQTKSVVFDYSSVGDTFAVSAGKIYAREEHEFYPALSKELDMRVQNS